MIASNPSLLANVTIGDAEPKNLDALAALIRRHPVASAALSYHVDRGPDPRALLQRIGTGYRLLVAEHDGAPVGTVTVVFDRAYRAGIPLDVAYTSDLKVEPAFRGTGLADALMRAAVAASRDRLGPDAPIITAVAGDNAAGLKKNQNLARDGQTTMAPFALVRLHVLLPAVPPFVLWGAGGTLVRRAGAADVGPMLALWQRVNGRKELARAYTRERFGAWMLETPGLTFWLAEERGGAIAAFIGVWDQSAYRRFVLGEASSLYQAARGAWTVGRLVGRLAPLPAPGQELAFRSVINLCAPAEATGALTAIIARALDEVRTEGALFLCWALDASDPLNVVADRFWGTRSSIRLLANEAFATANRLASGPVQAEVALG